MRILKFGGTSLQDARRIETAVAQIRGASGEVGVVVSALGGVTDRLGALADDLAQGRLPELDPAVTQIARRHEEMLASLAPPDEAATLSVWLAEQMTELGELLRGVSLVRECSARTRDEILAFGERLSAAIVAAALRKHGVPASSCDGRRIIVTDDRFGAARIDETATRDAVRRHFRDVDGVQVVTGFVGATAGGRTTTLGRGGSDLTAAVLGACLDAEAIEIWTDVDGVMTADPRLVPEAMPLGALSYEELMELSHFGARVVYPPTVRPARARGISLWIRNTLHPDFPGTQVVGHTVPRPRPVCGISSTGRVSLLRLEGDGMVGVPGVAARLFGALARSEVSVILISQASSEHSICFAVRPESVDAARRQVRREFELEQEAGRVDALIVEDDVAVVAVVGDQMRERPGLAGRIFGVLGAAGINVRAVAQGSSERNLSLVVSAAEEAAAVQAIHGAFFGPTAGSDMAGPGEDAPGTVPPRAAITATHGAGPMVSVFIVGAGRVGSALIDQILAGSGYRPDGVAPGSTLGVCGIARRRRLLLAADGVGSTWTAELAAQPEEPVDAPVARMVAAMNATSGRCVLVDCTASDTVPALYRPALASGVSVVAANKRFFAGPGAEWAAARTAAAAGGACLLHEASVGAGLPVVGPLAALMATGDEVSRIEGVFSGSTGFVLSRVRDGVLLSAAVREAAERGYTEPDPREDLTGMDVARKLLILARLSGASLEMDDVVVHPLVAGAGAGGSVAAFWERLPDEDIALANRQDDADARGEQLCYLARLDGGRAEVGLTAVPATHPCAGLTGTDNLFAFTTRRYAEAPLIIRGAGAGPEVTAAGVFGDILHAAAVMT
ncbi:MAG: aspartate kinase [Acidobacteriota bacterium]